MKKMLIALALSGLVATNAQARGGWHGHHGHGGFFWGAAVGAALTLPFYYYSSAWADPWSYYSYLPDAPFYANPPVYGQSQPTYAQSQPLYVQDSSSATTPAQPSSAGGTAPSNGVIELGPVDEAPSTNAGATLPGPGIPASAGQSYAYPSRGQSQQQAANDRYDCSRWATAQSGYDPDLRVHRNPQTGPENYARALNACLEGRGYTVR